MLNSTNRHQEEANHYRQVVKWNPDHFKAHRDLAWLLANCPDLSLRNTGQAVEHGKKAVELMPTDWTCLQVLGIAFYRAGDWNGALKELNQSVKLRKEADGYHLFFMAMAHGRLGDSARAHECFDQAVRWMVKTSPKHAELVCYRAEAAELLAIKEPTPNGEKEKQP
jgi:uncharacterized protein HemY